MKRSNRRRAPKNSFSVQNKTRLSYTLMACIGSALFISSFLIGAPNSGMSTLATVAVVFAIWSYQGKPFKLHADRVEFRGSPLAGLNIVGYDEIEMIDDSNPKKVQLHLTPVGRSKRKPVRMPLGLLTPEDGEELLNRLDELSAA